jgi:glycosyltransferase involved in cell wall biosynthesis
VQVSEDVAAEDSLDIILSVVVTGHAEGRLLRPTLRSIAAAITAVVETSMSCELVIALDNATAETVAEAESWMPPGRINVPVRIVRHSLGDAGASTSITARTAQGHFIAFCDGDDLVTRNYFVESLRLLLATPGPLIVHPSVVVSFGARSVVWRIPATESVDHRDLIRHNLWPSSSVSQRSTYLDHPYAAMNSVRGFGPEDWLWNIETSIAGIAHRPAPDTMFFYRVRQFGGVNNSHLHSILPSFDLMGLVTALPERASPPTGPIARLSPRERVRSAARRAYRISSPAVRVLKAVLSEKIKARLFAAVVRLYGGRSPRQLISKGLELALLDATGIEPALSWTAEGYAGLSEWTPPADGYSSLLISLVEQLRDRADAIVAVPWVGIGGADLVSLNYAKTLAVSGRFSGRVSVLSTYIPSRTLRHLVPENVNFVQIPETFRDLAHHLQRRLLAQVFILTQPKLIISVNCFDVTNSLQFYGRQLGSVSRIYLTLFAFDHIGAGYPTNPITDDSQRQYLDDIAQILTDNTVTAALLEEMLGLDQHHVGVHHQPALDPIPALNTETRAYNNRAFSAANPFKLLWPHRLDKEKRPDVLVELARRLSSQGLPVEIHIYGQQVLSTGGHDLMKSLSAVGVKYHGPYQGGLASLATHDYHALLLTSESEGLPLVLVQSMLLGLPVIATAVGGVSDIVRDRETGMLAADPDDIDGFIGAIRYLLDSVDNRRRIIHAAYDLAASQHGWPAFARLVDQLG